MLDPSARAGRRSVLGAALALALGVLALAGSVSRAAAPPSKPETNLETMSAHPAATAPAADARAPAAAAPVPGSLATAGPPSAPPPPGSPATPATPAASSAPTAVPVPVSRPAAGTLREPAPRPVADLRVQNRFATNAGTTQLFVGIDYFDRRDYYTSPGLRVGGTYYLGESLGVELQMSRFFSSLNHAATEVQHTYGLLPDSRAPTWLFLAGGRYALGFGKMMIGGVNHVVHFQPQALAQVGLHVYDGSLGPSGMIGAGLLVHITPRWFVRLDGAMTVELESRIDGTATVLGFLPSLVGGGLL
jgi:hypothetical protein